MNINQRKDIKAARKVVRKINRTDLTKASDKELREKTDEFKAALKSGRSKEDILPEAYAVCREASRRTLGMRHFDVQLIGGIVLNNGDIAEMATGEGKTLVATTAAYLNALDGKGVHIVTVNDYLAERDAGLMAPLYSFLGLTTGCIKNGISSDERKAAYNADITYGTSNEFGFDYLRDNMVIRAGQKVQRGLHYAIIDEVDSILIDEARTPLIISGSDPSYNQSDYIYADIFAKNLSKEDYEVAEKEKQISLLESGVSKAEEFYGIENLSDPANMEIHHFIIEALKANYLMKKNIDYIVSDDEVKIVDEFTGRVMEGRRFSEGLHQALEAKEEVHINPESKTFATITLQNYFRMYDKISGMTGTAGTEADEFREIYNMNVVKIPTNKPLRRIDNEDEIYMNEDAKWNAIVNEIVRVHKTGRPVLVGTTSVKNSEHLSELLLEKKIYHTVLNAKKHREEAEIIAQAGRYGAVTVATNMAGRGTDILLGGNPDHIIDSISKEREVSDAEKRGIKDYCQKQRDKIVSLGGLYVIGTERHESRRIDDQLRGRAGRQSDPGETRFFVSVTDELTNRYSHEEALKAIKRYGADTDHSVKSRMLTKLVEGTQKKVEGNNFAIRKNVLKYDNVLNAQRKVIYDQRDQILSGDDIEGIINRMIENIAEDIANDLTGSSKFPEEWDFEKMCKNVSSEFSGIKIIPPKTEEEKKKFEAKYMPLFLSTVLIKNHSKRRDRGQVVFDMTERTILLNTVDKLWADHLENMDEMKKGVGLMSLGQKDPAIEYARNGQMMFDKLTKEINYETVKYCFKINTKLTEAETN